MDDILRRKIPPALTERLADGKRQSAGIWDGVLADIDTLDPTLHRTTLIARSRTERQFDFMERKVLQAARRRDEQLRGQVQRLTAALAPRGGLQERTLCAPPFLARHGTRVLEAAQEAMDPFSPEHRVVEVDP